MTIRNRWDCQRNELFSCHRTPGNQLVPFDALLSYNAPSSFIELRSWETDQALLNAMGRCVEAQKAAVSPIEQAGFRPDPLAAEQVSEQALAVLLRNSVQRDHAVERRPCNRIVFKRTAAQGAVVSHEVIAAREQVDAIVAGKLRALFQRGSRLVIHNSGCFWYPPGGYMGWHTDFCKPGWRLYVTFVSEPDRSFFRYRNPDTGNVVTDHDRQWSFRLFRVRPTRLLWHAVYSDTHRFSVGYQILPPPTRLDRIRARLRIGGKSGSGPA